MLLSCHHIKKSFGIDVIIEDASFYLEEGEKAAIAGINGVGKTTLFQLLTEEQQPDEGSILWKQNAAIGYLKQAITFTDNVSIYAHMLSVFAPLLRLEEQMSQLEKNMNREAHLDKTMSEYTKLSTQYERLGGYQYKSKIRGVLKGLGFSEEDQKREMRTLSGGQKTRAHLAALLLTEPDVLLLDEPTNHLDIQTLQWLEEYLKGYPGALLLISHDRYFLDRIVTKVIELANKKASVYLGNYTSFVKQKEALESAEEKLYEKQQAEIKRQQEIIKTLRSFNREKSIKRAESREKMLQKVERVDRPDGPPPSMRITLKPKIQSGKDVLRITDLSKSFDQKHLFQGLHGSLYRGEKVALIGPNGVGKSTLFRMILGEAFPDAGNIQLGAQVHIGYYDQEQQNLCEDKTIFQEIADAYPSLTNGEIRNMLSAFVFRGDDVWKPISVLSGGERGRVSLAKIMLSKANFLLLDEPTNHLDIWSKQILEQALQSYEGTLFFISHDRYFINQVAQKIWEMHTGGLQEYLGNYDAYLEKQKQFLPDSADVAKQEDSITKENWKKQKEEESKKRKYQNALQKLEQDIDCREAKIKELEIALYQNSSHWDLEKTEKTYQQKAALEQEVEELLADWENLQQNSGLEED